MLKCVEPMHKNEIRKIQYCPSITLNAQDYTGLDGTTIKGNYFILSKSHYEREDWNTVNAEGARDVVE